MSEDADHFVGDERQEEVDDHVGVLPDADVDTLVRLPTADLAKKKTKQKRIEIDFHRTFRLIPGLPWLCNLFTALSRCLVDGTMR